MNNDPHNVERFPQTHLLSMADDHQTNHSCIFGRVCVCVARVHIPVCLCVLLHSFPTSEPTVWDAVQPGNHHLLPKLRARQSCTFR